MNEIDQSLHMAIHQEMMKTHPDRIFSPRVGVFPYLEEKLDLTVSGTALDIGCGSGYASIWLAKNRRVDKIYALEASEAAVRELLPRNIGHHGVDGIVEPVLGSFDAVPAKNLDFVVSFGALHHSPCLLSTMRSVSSALQEGGYLIAQEPVMPNMTTNQAFVEKYDVVEDRFGQKIRNGDRQDCFFREAEYIAAAAFSGLDLVFYDDYAPVLKREQRQRGVIANLRRWLGKGYRRLTGKANVHSGTSPLAKHTKTVIPKIMVFRKVTPAYIPHLWAALK
jgi:SAM-dependent methyltransferase